MIIATTKDGKKVSVATSDTITVPIGGANQGVVVRFSELSKVDYILEVNLTLDPVVDTGLPTNLDIKDNLVGFTVACGAGTTLTAEAIALGY